MDQVAWHTGNSRGKTHPVGQKKPNELGLCDMTGNVWEWCLDWDGAYASGALTDPTGPAEGQLRVSRGGSWLHNAWCCRMAYRHRDSRTCSLNLPGFRVALAAPVR